MIGLWSALLLSFSPACEQEPQKLLNIRVIYQLMRERQFSLSLSHLWN